MTHTDRWLAHPRLHHRTFALVHRAAAVLAGIGAVVLTVLVAVHWTAARYHNAQV